MEMALDWNNFNAISDIAFNHKINALITKVMKFIDNNFNHFVNKDIKQLSEMNDSTNDKLLELLANNYRKISKELSEIKESNKLLVSGKCDTCKIIHLDISINSVGLNRRFRDFNCKVCKKNIFRYV